MKTQALEDQEANYSVTPEQRRAGLLLLRYLTKTEGFSRVSGSRRIKYKPDASARFDRKNAIVRTITTDIQSMIKKTTVSNMLLCLPAE